MISGKTRNRMWKELQEITGTKLFLLKADGSPLEGELTLSEKERASMQALAGRSEEVEEVAGFQVLGLSLEGEDCLILASGEAAKMAVRLAASELRILESVLEGRRDRNGFFHQILEGELTEREIAGSIRQLRIRDEAERFLYLIQTEERMSEAAVQAVRTYFSGSRENAVILDMGKGRLAVILESARRKGGQERAQTEYAAQLYDILTAEALLSARLAYGHPAAHLRELVNSYQEALLAMRAGELFAPKEEVFSYTELGIGGVICQLPPELCREFLAHTFAEPVLDQLDEELRHTIKVLFGHSLNIAETARELYIHRNTLVYRLEKAERLLHLDIRKFKDAMTFQLADMINQYLLSLE